MIEIGYDATKRILPHLREKLSRAAASGQGSRMLPGE
jgi:hypothetical protein